MRRLGRALAVVPLLAAGGWAWRAAPAAAQQSAPVAFADPAPETAEGRSMVRIVVDRTDLPVARLVVTYATEDATARSGTDYVEAMGSLVFDVGVRTSSFVVQVRDDREAEPTEHLVLRLTADRTSTTARLAIVDDDLAASDGAATDGSASSASSARSGRSGLPASGLGAPAPASAAPAQAVPARTVQVPVRRRVVTPPARKVVLRQNPVTPFELRPAPSAADAVTGSLPNDPTVVDPVLALIAGLLLARVAAEVWFRSRAVVA